MLRFRTHVDAFWDNPADYAKCAWWWVTGKKLRARMHLAPLLAHSPHAYPLWKTQNLIPESPIKPRSGEPEILALIADGDGASVTIASCTIEGIDTAIVAGPGDVSPISLSRFEWILPIKAGDILESGAGARYRSAASNCHKNVQIIYADDDQIDDLGNTTEPHLKPDWNSELFDHHDYLTGAAILRTGRLNWGGDFADDWASALTQQAVAAGIVQGASPYHIRRILHHRTTRSEPRLPLPPVPRPRAPGSLPAVSVIIPTRNRLDLLRLCLKGLLQTDYPADLDIIVVDNGSDDPATLEYLADLNEDFARVLRDEGPFNFAALNNRAVERAEGQILCFLNNDIEIHDPHWLSTMVQQAMREDIGAVGARLLYPDGRIQHAGVAIGIGGAAAHAHRRLRPDEKGYFQRHSLPQFVSAVTAACLVVRRDRFLDVGGFDEQRFPVSFNDVDLCLKLGERGWRCLYEPRATLVHHESVSRGLDQDPEGASRQARETHALQEKWNTGLATPTETSNESVPDPYHHPGLSLLSERFALRL